MTKEEYLEKKKLLRMEFNQKVRNLAIEYVKSNNPYNLGDVITDHIGSIRMEKIQTAYDYTGFPDAVYTGLVLKKDLTPTKRMEKRQVWGGNIIDK